MGNIFCRIDIFYKDGRMTRTARSDEREAGKIKDRYEALPTVDKVVVTPVRRGKDGIEPVLEVVENAE
jgi:hypothetical protein